MASDSRRSPMEEVPGYGKALEREKKMEHGRAQARLSEDDALRTGYVGETPLEGGKIADSDPVQLFNAQPQQQLHRAEDGEPGNEEPSAPRGAQRAKQGMHGGRQLGRQ